MSDSLSPRDFIQLSILLHQSNPHLPSSFFCFQCKILLQDSLYKSEHSSSDCFCSACAQTVFSTEYFTPTNFNLQNNERIKEDVNKREELLRAKIKCPFPDCQFHDTIERFLNEHSSCFVNSFNCPQQCGWQGNQLDFITKHYDLLSTDCCTKYEGRCPWSFQNTQLYNRNSFEIHKENDHFVCQHPLADITWNKNDELIDHFNILPSTNFSAFSSSSSSPSSSTLMFPSKDKEIFISKFGYQRFDHECLWQIPFPNNSQSFVYSAPVYLCTNDPSYLFQFYICLNGQKPLAEGKFMSIFMRRCQGEWDKHLPDCSKRLRLKLIWPHESKPLWNYFGHDDNCFIFKPELFNNGTPCGEACFVPLDVLDQFVKDGSLFFHITYGL